MVSHSMQIFEFRIDSDNHERQNFGVGDVHFVGKSTQNNKNLGTDLGKPYYTFAYYYYTKNARRWRRFPQRVINLNAFLQK